MVLRLILFCFFRRLVFQWRCRMAFWILLHLHADKILITRFLHLFLLIKISNSSLRTTLAVLSIDLRVWGVVRSEGNFLLQKTWKFLIMWIQRGITLIDGHWLLDAFFVPFERFGHWSRSFQHISCTCLEELVITIEDWMMLGMVRRCYYVLKCLVFAADFVLRQFKTNLGCWANWLLVALIPEVIVE